MSTTKTPGQINYEGYYNTIDKPLTEWSKISEYYRKAWEAGAQAVIDAQPCPHPFKDVIIEYDMKKKCEQCGQKFD